MAESPDHAAAGAAAATSDAGESQIVNLPALVAPAPGAAKHQVEDKAAGQSAEATGAPVARARSKRFMMLAASVAFAAGFGSFVGSVSGSGLVRLIYPPPAPVATPASGIENTIAAMREIKLELVQVAALKSSLENTARNTTSQYAKISDRLDRLDQRGIVAAETTASLPVVAPAVPAALPTAAEPPKLSDRVLQDWIVHDVQHGRALVESRYGGLFAVAAGSVLPGIGRVDTIKRQDGHWVVLTARGTITSAR
jgi:hypothetical protein